MVSTTVAADRYTFRGNDKLIFAIVPGVIPFGLFAPMTRSRTHVDGLSFVAGPRTIHESTN